MEFWQMRNLRITPRSGIIVFALAAVAIVVFSHYFLQEGMWAIDHKLGPALPVLLKGSNYPPIFAYLISGTGGEGKKMLRLLKAVYHPRNHYLLYLDAASTDIERNDLANDVESERVFRTFGNVDIVGKSNPVDETGSSIVAATLHGAAVLLRINTVWDWFITLSASDYPLITQDDLLHVFSSVPRNLSFIDHTSDLGWKEHERFHKFFVDPNLYMKKKSEILLTTGGRATPDAFKLFTGSPWLILSRPFVEHCVHSWDNLPRKVLMYFANTIYAMESYFQTVICNAPEFRKTTVNNDLRYITWDDPPGLHPLYLNQSHYKVMLKSGAAFARPFREDDPVLQKVDKRILRRSSSSIAVGKWCSGHNRKKVRKDLYEDPCKTWSDINIVEPGPAARKLGGLVSDLISHKKLHLDQCKVS